MKFFLISSIFFLSFSVLLSFTARTTFAATPLYPDLRTIAPSELHFDTETINGSEHHVIRFTNTVWNAGEGTLELHGIYDSAERTRVFQRVYNDDGSSTDQNVGFFVFHAVHNHWHFEDFAEYQLWTREEYDAWVQNGRNVEDTRNINYKTTFCIRETELVQHLPSTPERAIHTQCGQEVQGLSVGWGDSYRYDLPEQWIDVGESMLPDGYYVIRSIVDPKNLLKESADNNPSREGDMANEAVRFFSVVNGQINLTNPDNVTLTPLPVVWMTPTPYPVVTVVPTHRNPHNYEWNHHNWRQLLNELIRQLNEELPMW